MRTVRTIFSLFVFLSAFSLMSGQTAPVEKGLATIDKEIIQAQLEFLSSDWMEGREATTKGEFLAGDYLASLFKLYGIKPAGDFDYVQGGRGRRAQFQLPGQSSAPQGQEHISRT